MEKYLPDWAKKKEALEILKNNGNSIRCIRRTINDVIIEKRGLNKNDLVFVKNIQTREWQEIIDLLGMPRGYRWRNNH
jgi:hypothetical protein